MRHQHGPRCGCGCQKGPKQIIHPVKENVVHNCTEETIEHIYPSHTTVMNHHVINNKHMYPHSTSVENTCNSVDKYGKPFNVPGNQVGGAMDQGKGNNNQVGGVGQQKPCHKMPKGHGHHMPPEMNHWNKPNKWC